MTFAEFPTYNFPFPSGDNKRKKKSLSCCRVFLNGAKICPQMSLALITSAWIIVSRRRKQGEKYTYAGVPRKLIRPACVFFSAYQTETGIRTELLAVKQRRTQWSLYAVIHILHVFIHEWGGCSVWNSQGNLICTSWQEWWRDWRRTSTAEAATPAAQTMTAPPTMMAARGWETSPMRSSLCNEFFELLIIDYHWGVMNSSGNIALNSSWGAIFDLIGVDFAC